jgi:hypothetical protein
MEPWLQIASLLLRLYQALRLLLYVAFGLSSALSIFLLSKVSQVNTKSSIVDMLLQINLHKTIPFHYSGIKTPRQKVSSSAFLEVSCFTVDKI